MTAISEFFRILPGSDRKAGFVTGVALAENDQSDIVGEQPVEQRHEEVESFFRDKTRHHSKHRAGRSGGKTESIEK